ncbi:hypothetical protein ACWEOH_02420 [Agromyces sp. NPDC004153]
MNQWTFRIKPWNPEAHDVDEHKRRAKVYIEHGGIGLWRGDTVGMSGPEVVEHPDGSASVTYTYTPPAPPPTLGDR